MSTLRLTRRPDMLVVIALAVLAGAIAATVNLAAPRIVAGIALELFLTGYAIAALVSVGPRPIDRAELALRTLGSSLVVAALGGLALDVLPGHEGRVAWSVLLVLVTSLAAAGAIAGTGAVEDDERGFAVAQLDPEPCGPGTRRARSRPVANLACALAAAAIAVAAIVLAQHSARRAAGFTQLSALPSSAAHDPAVLIRIRSHEHRTTGYRLTVSEDHRRVTDVELRLPAGGEWRQQTRAVRAATHRLVVSVYRAGYGRRLLYSTYYPPAPRARLHAGGHRPSARRSRAP